MFFLLCDPQVARKPVPQALPTLPQVTPCSLMVLNLVRGLCIAGIVEEEWLPRDPLITLPLLPHLRQDDEHIVLEPGDLFPPFSPPPSPRGEVKKGPQNPQQHRLFRVLETPVIDNIRWGRYTVPQPIPPEPPRCEP